MTVVTRRIDAIRDAVRQAERILPVAGGTKAGRSIAAGATPLDVSELSGITEYDPGELTFTALAATPVAEVADALAGHGQYLPFDPLLAAAGSTLAGTVASATSGSNALRHGGVRDFVIGVRLVDGAGELVSGGGKVVKNAAGFDLPKLMVGSMGRLGVIVQLSFKVFPRPRATTTLVFEPMARAEQLAAIARLAGGPIQIDALDLDDGDRMLVRLGGAHDLLPARAQRVVGVVSAHASVLDGDEDATLWRDASELSWVPQASITVRVPITARDVTQLDHALTATSARVRYGLAANVAWIAWPEDRDIQLLDVILSDLGLAATTITGRRGVSPLGLRPGGGFASRVRRALNPNGCFPED